MDTVSEPLESSAASPNLPPLRLTHVLLYLAVCSAYLSVAMSRRLSPAIDLRQAADERYRRIIEVPGAFLFAATTSVFIFLVVWTVQRRRVWDQPGHWIALWVVWGTVSIHCVRKLFQLTRVLAGVGLHDDWTVFWQWAKSIYALQYLPFAVLFVCIALGWRQIANTWPWRLYFATAGLWLLIGPTMSNLPFDLGDTVYSMWPKFVRLFFVYQRELVNGLLLVAMVNDLLSRHAGRHWSHWVPAVHPLLAYGISYLPAFVWDFFHPSG